MSDFVTKEPIAKVDLYPEGAPLPAAAEEPYAEAGQQQTSVGRLTLVWAARRRVAKCTLLGAVIALVISLLIPNRYTTTARLMPPDNKPSAGLLLSALSGGGSALSGLGMLSGLMGGNTTGDMFIGVLRSRTVEDAVIQHFDLMKAYDVKRMADARKKLEARTDISADRKSGIISIEVTDKDRNRAAEMAATYVQQLDRLVVSLSTSSARRERIFLEHRLQSVKTDLDDASQKLGEFSAKNTALDISQQSKAMVEAAAQLQGELIAAQSQLRGLEEIYSDNNIRVRSLRARVAELNRKLADIGGTDVENGGTNVDNIFPSIRKLPLLAVTYLDLYRRAKIQEAVYETLSKQYELARVEEAKEIPTVKVLDPPEIPEKKSFPPRSVITILGAVVMLLSAVAWTIAEDAWLRTDPADPRRLLALDVWESSSVATRRVFGRVRSFRRRDAGTSHGNGTS